MKHKMGHLSLARVFEAQKILSPCFDDRKLKLCVAFSENI